MEDFQQRKWGVGSQVAGAGGACAVRERATHSGRLGGVTNKAAGRRTCSQLQPGPRGRRAGGRGAAVPQCWALLPCHQALRGGRARMGHSIRLHQPPAGWPCGGPAATKKHRAQKLSTTSLTDAPRTQPACSADSPYRPRPGLLPGGRRRPLCPCSLLAPWARDFSHCVLRKGARRVYGNHGNRA